MNNKKLHTTTGKSQEVILVDFQRIAARAISYWWLFALCFLIAIGAGQLYLRYTVFEYSSRAVLLIKDAGRSGNLSEQSILLSGAGLSGGGKSMDNEIQILKSLSIMEKVVERLELNVSYFRQGNVKETELYVNSPFFLDSFELNPGTGSGTFFIDLNDYETFLFKTSEDDKEGVRCNFGVPFHSAKGRFLINLNPKEAIVKGTYRMTVGPPSYSASEYRSNLSIQRIGGQHSSSVLDLKIIDPVAQKTADILNTLIEVYNEEEINDENQVFRNTLDFIDSRVASLVYELDSVDGGIQRFKSANELISNNASSSMDYTLGEIRKAVQDVSDYDIQKNLLESLEKFLVEKSEYHLIPANLIAENPVLSDLVNQYNSLVLQYKKIATTASNLNPARIALESQIEDIRNLITETIQNLQKDIQIPIAKIERNIENLKRSMGSIPGIEKRLIEKMRTQAVKENLFLFLLQKREETALSEAVTTAKTRIIDPARIPGFPIYPKRNMIRAASSVLGLTIPMIIVLLLGLFETKVDSEETIKQLTSIPILGKVALGKGKEHIVVKQGSRSAVNEMFRLLRTRLNFLNSGKTKQKILITSSISGEGKTFVALNLGITLALSGKKVALLGLDLRKPKLGSYLNANLGIGITNYLIDQNSLEEITQSFSEQPNLSIITSGPVPPNPAELILSDRMKNMLDELSEKYDYVLVDTPPVGLVSDALLLRDYVDNMLIVVHQDMTKKVMLKDLEAMHQNEEIQRGNIVFNGVKQGGSYYGYSGYNQGYYIDEK